MRTKVVCHSALVVQRTVCTHGHDGLALFQRAESAWTALVGSPVHLLLDDMEHGNNIAETAIGEISHPYTSGRPSMRLGERTSAR
jgi:hypothetical protein